MTTLLEHAAEIAAALAATDIELLELTGPAGRLRLRRDGTGVAIEVPAANEALADRNDASTVTSPGVGRFVSAHPLHETPIVQPGERVAVGQTLGLLQIGALLIPVTAAHDGVVRGVIASEGSLAGFGDPLFEIEPACQGPAA